jgi:Fe-S cluster assembly protein SufD
MNKIIVNGDKIIDSIDTSLQINIKEKQDTFDITKIEIEVLKNTDLMIEYNNNEITKLDINIKINKNIEFKLYELRCENEIKVQYKYNLEEFSNVLVNKFYDCNKVRELVLINLNGMNSEINYNFNSISKEKQKIDLVVYHNNVNTISNVTNKAVNILDGSTTFNITGIVYNKINDCIINQNNRIINLNEKKCTINPILLIDENDVEANHSALIGKFSDKELFYLMSRGINKEQALNLLIKGFLAIDIKNKEKVEKIIDKYWR